MSDNDRQCQNCDKIGGDMLRYWHNSEWFDCCCEDCAQEVADFYGLDIDHENRRMRDRYLFDCCDDAEDYGEEL